MDNIRGLRLDFSKEWAYDTLGMPCTPGVWLSDPNYIPVTKIKMTCGGGIGGSKWEVFAKEIPLEEFDAGKMIVVDVIDQRNLDVVPTLINPKYIVDVVNGLDICYALFSTTNSSYAGKWYAGKIVKHGRQIRLLDEYEGSIYRVTS